MTVQSVISVGYYAFVAWMAGAMIRNLIQTRSWERECLYVVVLLAFALRLLQLK